MWTNREHFHMIFFINTGIPIYFVELDAKNSDCQIHFDLSATMAAISDVREDVRSVAYSFRAVCFFSFYFSGSCYNTCGNQIRTVH